MVLLAATAIIYAASLAQLAIGSEGDAENPRVMLLIDEKNLGTIPTSEVEAMAVKLLLERDLAVVDQEMVRANLKKDQQLLKMAGDARGAAAVGLQFGADIIIVGEVVAKPSARRLAGSNLRTYQAVATLRAVQTDNSLTLASASEVSSIIGLEDVGGSSKALKASGRKALPSLIDQMMEKWDDGHGIMRGPKMIEISVGGVDATWKVRNIRKQFEKLDDLIVEVTQRSYTPGAASFDVLSMVPAKDLAEQLVLQPPKKLKFQVLNVTSRKINLRAVRK